VSALTVVHIAFGSAALLSGAGAMAFRKGGRLHAKAGTIFFAAMLVMASTGSVMATLRVERGTMVIGILTFYLVVTSWWTARHRDGRAGRFELLSLGAALALGTIMATFGAMALNSANGRLDSLPASAHFPFAVVMLIAAAGELNFLLRRTLSGRQRVARHVWRMSVALFIAAASFFLGQQDEFTPALKGLPIWFVPPFAILLAMIFWLLRVRFAKAWAWAVPRRRADPLPAAGTSEGVPLAA
jgi:uncharacterized membrane protein